MFSKCESMVSYLKFPTSKQVLYDLQKTNNTKEKVKNLTWKFSLETKDSLIRISFWTLEPQSYFLSFFCDDAKYEYTAFIESEQKDQKNNITLYRIIDHRCGEPYFQEYFDSFLWQILRLLQKPKNKDNVVIWMITEHPTSQDMKLNGFRLYNELTITEQQLCDNFPNYLHTPGQWEKWFFIEEYK